MKTGKIITSFIAGAVTGWVIKSLLTDRRNSFKRINQKRVNDVADYYKATQRTESRVDEMNDHVNPKDVTGNYQEEYLK